MAHINLKLLVYRHRYTCLMLFQRQSFEHVLSNVKTNQTTSACLTKMSSINFFINDVKNAPLLSETTKFGSTNEEEL